MSEDKLTDEDRRRIDEVLKYLARDIRDDMPDEGTVSVSLWPVADGGAQVTVEAWDWRLPEAEDQKVHDYFRPLPVPRFEHDGEMSYDHPQVGALPVAWIEVVVPWLQAHGIDARQDWELLRPVDIDTSVEFDIKSWRPGEGDGA